MLAFVSVAVAAVAVGILVGLVLASDKHQREATSPRIAALGGHRHGSAARSRTGRAASNRGRPSPSSHKSPPVAPPVASSSQVPQNAQGSQTGTEIAARLNDRGFQLMNEGRYGDAVPLLRRAVSASSPTSSGLTYAYALFNLGRSLRLAGRSDEAVPLLERRLRIDNQRATVARELQAARRSAHSTGGSR
jgi:tetratricopeptide (TPR) repeat protein